MSHGTKHKPCMVEMEFTPALATKWLAANTHNRHLYETVLERYQRMMLAGDWISNPAEPLVFSRGGVLLDGQHRLEALRRAGKTLKFWVVLDAPVECQSYIDRGRPRTALDVMQLRGRLPGAVSKAHLATLRGMFAWTRGRCKPTDDEEERMLKRHWEAVEFAIAALPRRVNGIASGMSRGVIARAWYSAERGKLLHFCEVLTTGIGVPGDAAIRLLNVALQQGRFASATEARMTVYGKVERALLAYLNGERITRLYAAESELFPLPEEIVSKKNGSTARAGAVSAACAVAM